jgi:DNA-binding transcriptional regulator GbsR (MarR family)
LAEDMGLTRPRVTQLLSELQSFDLIEIERRGQGKTNFYTVNFVVKRKGAKGSNTQK